MSLGYDVLTSPSNPLDGLLHGADPLSGSSAFQETAAVANAVSSGVNLGNALSGEEVGAIMRYAKTSFDDTVNGWIQGFDPVDTRYKWLIGDASSSIDWNVTAAGTLTIFGVGLVSPTLSYGKTSFTDSVNAGYYISSAGIYVGAAGDASKLKYTVADGSFDFVGTVSSRSTLTLASAVNASGNLVTDIVNARIDSSAKTILSDFSFGASDYAGGVKSGDIAWNTTTGAITGGSGVVVYRGGIVGAAAGVATFSIDAATGAATFAGALSAPTGTIGGFTIGATTLSATNLALTSGAANVANISVGTGSSVAGLNAGNTSTDIAFWAGDTYANRASAPFRIDLSGLTTITLPSGSSSLRAFSVVDDRAYAGGQASFKVTSNDSICSYMYSGGDHGILRAISGGINSGAPDDTIGVVMAEVSGTGKGPAYYGLAEGLQVAYFRQGAATSTNYYKMVTMDGDGTPVLSQWVANNTTPNGTLTGAKGDLCQSTNGKLYVNTDGTTAWAELSTGGGGDYTVPVNAGQDIAAGDAVVVEAGGLYRTRSTGLSSKVAAVTTIGGDYCNLTYNRRRYLNMSSTVKCTFQSRQVTSTAPWIHRYVVAPSSGTVTSGSTSQLTNADANNVYSMDAVKLTDSTFLLAYVVNITADSSKKLRCKLITTSSSISEGAIATSAETVDYLKQLSVERISDTEAVVFFSDGTDVKAQYVTVSGTTCTFSTVSTIKASAAYPETVCRYGTTDYYCFVYSDASPATAAAICASESGGTFTVETETSMASVSAGYSSSSASADDTTVVFANVISANYTTYVRSITRSGTALTDNAATSPWNDNGDGRIPVTCLTKVTPTTFTVSGSRYDAGPLYRLAAQQLSVDGAAVATVGSAIVDFVGSSNNYFIVGPGEFCASKMLAFFVQPASLFSCLDCPINLITNQSKVIGLAAEDISSGSQGKVTLSGLNQQVSGKTALSSYYTYLDGQVTSTLTSGGTYVGRALTSSCINVKIST
ncbi:MAG: hypothetical protein M0R37_14530 [Bacteroidales bacterium]|nr:hypothetical protein [Bacteroidales bacterium]